MNKVIFLDIDGVLRIRSIGTDRFGPLFHEHFVINLQNIIKNTGADIVIISTWKQKGLKTLNVYLETYLGK
jgi:histidinol phosphatase-like enzyme